MASRRKNAARQDVADAAAPAAAADAHPGALFAWLSACRPKTLSASLTPILVGASLAHADGVLEAPHLCVTWFLFALFVQIGTNLHNDYADFVKGADTDERLGAPRASQKGWLKPGEVAAGATAALLVALALGVPLVQRAGRPFVPVVLSSVFCAVAYTGGPYPLGYVGLGWVSLGYAGLGDAFVLAYFGFVATCGTYYLQAGAVTAQCLVAGFAVGCLATAIIVVNNLRDRLTDAKVGKRTLAVRFGPTVARAEYVGLLAAAYAAVVGAYAAGLAPRGWLWVLVSLPLAAAQARKVLGRDGAALNDQLGGTAKVELVFGACFAVGVVWAGGE